MKIKTAGFGNEGLTIVLDAKCPKCQSKDIKLGGVSDNKVWMICQECENDFTLKVTS